MISITTIDKKKPISLDNLKVFLDEKRMTDLNSLHLKIDNEILHVSVTSQGVLWLRQEEKYSVLLESSAIRLYLFEQEEVTQRELSLYKSRNISFARFSMELTTSGLIYDLRVTSL